MMIQIPKQGHGDWLVEEKMNTRKNNLVTVYKIIIWAKYNNNDNNRGQQYIYIYYLKWLTRENIQAIGTNKMVTVYAGCVTN